MNTTLSLLILHSGGFTHNDLKKLFEIHQNYSEVLEDFLHARKTPTPWMTQERSLKILDALKLVDQKRIALLLEEKQIQIIPISSPQYPERLRSIKQAPYLLYIRGNLREIRRMIAIVGSRRSTSYGKRVLESIIPDLVRADCGIVSGGAHGIDALSHSIALDSGGYTLSVFGSGIDIFYPRENTKLFENILSHGGALLSIFPIGTEPEPYYFPIRNEIVAALSDGVIVPEAGAKSGTLITASLALEHGRDVFAIPGDIFKETSAGTNGLIARGEAKCIQNATDILEEYFPNMASSTISLHIERNWENIDQENIFNCIVEGYNTPDSIGQNSDYSIDTITTTLTLLEIAGHIRLGPSGKYDIISL